MLAFSFLTPALLPFAALAAVPLLIYLWQRQRHTPMAWAAMAFIMKAMARNKRRLRFENLLLLLLRILVVLFFVLAFTRPVLSPSEVVSELGEGPRGVILVIDPSYSMALRDGSTDSFTKAKEAAIALSEALLRDQDRVAIFLTTARGGDKPYLFDPVMEPGDLERLKREITDLEIVNAPGDPARALRAVVDFLPTFNRGGRAGLGIAKQVFLLTDMQRGGYAVEDDLKDPELLQSLQALKAADTQLRFIDCGSDSGKNAAVTSLTTDSEVIGTGQRTLLVAEVESFAERTISLDLVVTRDRDEVRTLPVTDLEPGERRQLSVYVQFDEAGTHTVSVTLRTDDLLVDNDRHLAFEVQEELKVALVDGERGTKANEGETYYLQQALAPGGGDRVDRDLIRPEITFDLEEALETEFEDGPPRHRVIVVANLWGLEVEVAEKLEGFVERGGGLLLFPGPLVDLDVWNTVMWKEGKGLLPARLAGVTRTEEDSRYFRLQADTFAHPILDPFGPLEFRELFQLPRFTGLVDVEPLDSPDVSVIANFEVRYPTSSGAAVSETATSDALRPALIERRFGRGRVLLFASTADGAWNNFFAEYSYLILWQRAVTYLAQAGSARRNLEVGEPFDMVLLARDHVNEIGLTTPNQSETARIVPEKIDEEEDDRYHVGYARTTDPGVYQLTFPGRDEHTDAFAVNVDTEESNLTRIDARELQSLLPGVPIDIKTAEEVAQLTGGSGAKAEGLEIWTYLIAAALALMVLESFVASRFSRRAAAAA